MSKKIIGIIIAIVVLLGAIVIIQNSQKNEGDSIKLGLMLPLTGDYGAAGQNMQKGMELAIEKWQNENPEIKIDVVIEDDAYDVVKGMSAYKKLVELDKVDMILMLSTPVIDAIYKDVVQKGIPVIQLGVQTVGVADDNIIQFSPSAEAPIGYLANYLANKEDFYSKKVAVIYDNASAQINFFNAFKEIYNHEYTTFIVNGKNDLRGYATKIANEGYEGVVIIQSPENGALFTKELLAISKQMPQLAIDAQLQTGFADFEKILGDANKLNGTKSMWFKAGKMDEVTRLFKEKYNEEPGFLVDFSYDMINTALATYNKDDTKWISNLKKFKDPNGASGSISFDNLGTRIQPMTITEVQNGKLVPVE
jgi:branched-chain amino acid transport system substrate-binding protein